MAVKKIYLVRHGQTDYNKQGIVQGSGIDSDLNALGRAQGEAFFNAYKQVPFQKVYTSALKRTMQSVQHFLDLGLPHEALAGLNEISWGNKEGKRYSVQDDQLYTQMLQDWRNGKVDRRVEGGESPLEVSARVAEAMAYIVSQPEELVLICMHGRAIRVLLATVLNYPLGEMDAFEHTNLCLYRLTYTGSMYVVNAYNDTAHLAGLVSEPMAQGK